MTRLTVEDLNQGPKDLNTYDQKLKDLTNMNLLELALKTMDMTIKEYNSKVSSLTWVAVIPTTIGKGILPGFSDKVAEVGRHLGLPCRVTVAKDVAGLAEAVGNRSEIIFIAEDNVFLALNLISRRVIDNSVATGEIYAAALVGASKGAANQYIGVLGLGPVGQAAAIWFHSEGVHLVVYDKNQEKQTNFLSGYRGIRGAESVEEVLNLTDLVLDATNVSNIIKVKELKNPLILAAPGIPLGIDDPNSNVVQLIHDPLQLGVAAMMVQVLV